MVRQNPKPKKPVRGINAESVERAISLFQQLVADAPAPATPRRHSRSSTKSTASKTEK